jgi:hypothetical protein
MDHIYKEAREVEERCRAYADSPNSNEIQALVKEARDMYESIEMKKSTDHIEDRVGRVMDRLFTARDSGHISMGDARDLESRLRKLEQQLRKI